MLRFSYHFIELQMAFLLQYKLDESKHMRDERKKTACMSAEMRIVSSISEFEGYEQLLRTWIYDA